MRLLERHDGFRNVRWRESVLAPAVAKTGCAVYGYAARLGHAPAGNERRSCPDGHADRTHGELLLKCLEVAAHGRMAAVPVVKSPP